MSTKEQLMLFSNSSQPYKTVPLEIFFFNITKRESFSASFYSKFHLLKKFSFLLPSLIFIPFKNHEQSHSFFMPFWYIYILFSFPFTCFWILYLVSSSFVSFLISFFLCCLYSLAVLVIALISSTTF